MTHQPEGTAVHAALHSVPCGSHAALTLQASVVFAVDEGVQQLLQARGASVFDAAACTPADLVEAAGARLRQIGFLPVDDAEGKITDAVIEGVEHHYARLYPGFARFRLTPEDVQPTLHRALTPQPRTRKVRKDAGIHKTGDGSGTTLLPGEDPPTPLPMPGPVMAIMAPTAATPEPAITVAPITPGRRNDRSVTAPMPCLFDLN